jgi:hypothetical protein
MSCVSLVCTVHEEKGLATVLELRSILERIRPEVIFTEIPPAAFDDFFRNFSRTNLESQAVRQFQENHLADIVPVDLATPDEAFFRNAQILFEWIERRSQGYRRLIDSHSANISAYGFAYLNSEDCSKLWSAVYEEMLSTINHIGDIKHLELYRLWRETIARRDSGMMDNILQYCRSKPFDRGVFLIGAAHRQSVIDKAREQSAPHSVRWEFPVG